MENHQHDSGESGKHPHHFLHGQTLSQDYCRQQNGDGALNLGGDRGYPGRGETQAEAVKEVIQADARGGDQQPPDAADRHPEVLARAANVEKAHDEENYGGDPQARRGDEPDRKGRGAVLQQARAHGNGAPEHHRKHYQQDAAEPCHSVNSVIRRISA